MTEEQIESLVKSKIVFEELNTKQKMNEWMNEWIKLVRLGTKRDLKAPHELLTIVSDEYNCCFCEKKPKKPQLYYNTPSTKEEEKLSTKAQVFWE